MTLTLITNQLIAGSKEPLLDGYTSPRQVHPAIEIAPSDPVEETADGISLMGVTKDADSAVVGWWNK